MAPIRRTSPALICAAALGWLCAAHAAAHTVNQTAGPDAALPPQQTTPAAPEDARPLGPGRTPGGPGLKAPDPDRADSSGWRFRTIASLAAVLVLIAAGAAVVRVVATRQGGLAARLGPGGRAPAGLLEVLGRYPVGRGQTLVLLKLDRRVLLLSQSGGGRLGGGGFRTLCEVTDPEDVASILVKAGEMEGQTLSTRFRSMLERFDPGSAGAPSPPDAAMRRQNIGADGDRVELWDNPRGDEPLVDPSTWSSGGGLDRAGDGPGAVGSLRRRLEAMREDQA